MIKAKVAATVQATIAVDVDEEDPADTALKGAGASDVGDKVRGCELGVGETGLGEAGVISEGAYVGCSVVGVTSKGTVVGCPVDGKCAGGSDGAGVIDEETFVGLSSRTAKTSTSPPMTPLEFPSVYPPRRTRSSPLVAAA